MRWLLSEYKLPQTAIYGHKYTPENAGTTDCPNHLFARLGNCHRSMGADQHLIAVCSGEPRSGRIIVFNSNATWANNRRGPLRDVCLLRWHAPGAAQQNHTQVASKGHSRAKGRDKRNRPQRDCVSATGPGEHTCLVVNDENPRAACDCARPPPDCRPYSGPDRRPWARLADNVPLEGFSVQAAVDHASRQCPDRSIAKDFDEFDGEGVAWSSTASGVYSTSLDLIPAARAQHASPLHHLLARFRVDGNGRLSGPRS